MIYEYILEDENGNRYKYVAKDLKFLIKNNEIKVENLKLTADNKLITTYQKKILFNGREYESRRYTLEELDKLFHGYIAIIEDPKYKNNILTSGKLIGLCDVKDKNKIRLNYMKSGIKNVTLWDLSPIPLFVGFKEVLL